MLSGIPAGQVHCELAFEFNVLYRYRAPDHFPMERQPRILTIAGSDSSGGAGIEADLKVITAHRCYGMTAITGLTAQNTKGVVDIHPIPAQFLRKTIFTVVEDIGVDVVKMGMLTSSESIDVVVEAVKKYNFKQIVLDPVIISTSGSVLLPPDAISALCNNLIPLATLITPNIPEAQHLLSYYITPDSPPTFIQPPDSITSMVDVVTLAKRLYEFSSTAVLVKGGHLPFAKDGSMARRAKDKAAIMDVLVLPNGTVKIFNSPFIDNNNTHGTGCSLASAIACNLATNPLSVAVFNARNYISGAIAAAYPLGQGSGPINHVHNTYQLPYSKGRFFDYLTTHPRVAKLWDQYVNHDFVKKVANGSIEIERFGWYLRQDYLFLVHFARATSLLAYKSLSLPQISSHADNVSSLLRETGLHVQYCASLGISESDLQSTLEAPATIAYTRYVIDVGMRGDKAALVVALISCMVGYQVAARNREIEEGSVRTEDGNKFWSWVEEYAGEGYEKGVQAQKNGLEDMAMGFSVKQVEELVEIFRAVTEMERDFFTAALEAKVDESEYPKILDR
ncbi:hypothetical protein H072_642 [Dactylellina haptotyla CBS 200.50]|uniref:Pyridoxamine kinase/Phosphomethylpyrimidine kinase domain-containing protein n=1 Tax=Dactylellina haptotyla (strain CBS 200.50) TaxID=1284197 RepID=S8CCU7_DACHA|nr:hypothetical protein H072_642 [Dactylellina haptotyla CBS 200.50]